MQDDKDIHNHDQAKPDAKLRDLAQRTLSRYLEDVIQIDALHPKVINQQ